MPAPARLRRASVAVLAAAAVALGAAPAHAQDISAKLTVSNGHLVLIASDGVRDRVTVRYFFDFIEVEDTLVRIDLQDFDSNVTCTQPYAHIVRCTPASLWDFRAILRDGDDTFTNRTALPSDVRGDDGNDTLTGGSGQDRLFGDAGEDTLHGGAEADDIEGGPGKDKVYGDEGNDNLRSFHHDDELFGGPGNDTLVSSIDVHGGPGDDWIVMDFNRGEYWGDEGGDTIDYSGWTWAKISLDGNDNDTGGAVGDGWHNVHGDVDIITGSPGVDELAGNDSPNRLEGGEGNDWLFGKGGNDILNAGNGDSQRVDGGEGYDICTGYNIYVQRGCD